MLVVTDLSGNSEIINKFNNFEMFEELNGSFTLSFTSYRHIDNPGHDLIIQEGFVEYDGYKFRIKQLRKQINSIQVACLSTFYDNADVYKYDIYGGTHTLNEFLTYVLANTGWTWTSTNIDIEQSKFIPNFGQNNVIQLIEALKGVFGLEVGINRNNQIVVSDRLGPDNDSQYRYGHNIISLAESIDTTKLKTYIEGFGANGIHVTYTSPYASNPGIGIRHAEPIYDDSYTDANTLVEHIKTQLYDHPDSVVELDDDILIDKELGERVWLIHERMGIEYQTRVVSRRIKIPNSLSSVTLATYLPQSRSIGNELADQRVTIDRNNKLNRSRIEQTNDKIELEVTRLDGADETLQANLTIQADRITTEVTERQQGDADTYEDSRSYTEQTATSIRSEVSTEVTRLDGRVDSSDSLILQNANEILLRVREDGIISAINQTAESIRISALRINLQGSVTFSDFNPDVNSKFTKIDGDGIYTGSIYADQVIGGSGNFAELTVDELDTSDKIINYLSRIKDDVNYIRVNNQKMELIQARYVGDSSAVEQIEQAVDRNGTPIYWTDDTFQGMTVDPTDWPVTVYKYNEYTKGIFEHYYDSPSGLYIPRISLGIGSGVGDRQKAFITKEGTGLSLSYIKNNDQIVQIRLGEDGLEGTNPNMTNLRLYDDGMISSYSDNKTYDWSFVKNGSGQITSITNNTTEVKTTITWNTGAKP